MTTAEAAAQLGRKGGRARAARLSPERRAEIAALGAAARKRSLDAARRIRANFDYLRAVEALRPPTPPVSTVKTCAGPLPGLHRSRP